jgi:hypothetical protein
VLAISRSFADSTCLIHSVGDKMVKLVRPDRVCSAPKHMRTKERFSIEAYGIETIRALKSLVGPCYTPYYPLNGTLQY